MTPDTRPDEVYETETAKRWAEAYATRSGVTVEFLREHGREVRPCDCGENGCEGWQMAHVKELELELKVNKDA